MLKSTILVHVNGYFPSLLQRASFPKDLGGFYKVCANHNAQSG